jgi:hypothetical protein
MILHNDQLINMLEAFALGSIHKPSLSQDNKFQFYPLNEVAREPKHAGLAFKGKYEMGHGLGFRV